MRPRPVRSARRAATGAAVAVLLGLLGALLPATPASAADALILSPQRDDVVGARVQVDVRGFEATRVEVLVDGVSKGVDDTPAPYTSPFNDGGGGYQLFSVVVDLSGLSGQHVIAAVATGSGEPDRDERTVTVDTQAPSLTLPASLGTQGRPVVATASEPLVGPVDGAAVLVDSRGRRLPLSMFCHTSASPDTAARGCADSGATRYPGFRLASGQLVTGERYQLELLKVTDVAGNAPVRTRYPLRAPTALSDEAELPLRWARIANTRASGGSYLQSRDVGSGLTVFTGQSSLSIGVVRGPGLGVLEITGGRTTRRVDLYSPTVQYGTTVVYDFGCGTGCFLQFAQLRVTGSRNSRSTGTAVAVDGVLSRSSSGATSPAAVIEEWRRVAQTGATAGVVRESTTPGAAIEVPFRSTRVDWTTVVGPDQGIADVLVDGRRVARFDGYAPARRLVHRYVDVPDGVHTLRIVVTGAKRAASRGAGVSVERVAVR